jgi:3-hydroxyacyl-[acyl-carrier-protein] dehydratase
MDREEIKKYLPHREPMLLVDEAEIDGDGVCHAKYRVREDEFFLRGHFPDNPVVPGVILCEMMAQSCALLVGGDIVGKTTLYAGINNMKFKHIVRPGELCEVTARLVSRRGTLVFCSVELCVDGSLCCKGEISFAMV